MHGKLKKIILLAVNKKNVLKIELFYRPFFWQLVNKLIHILHMREKETHWIFLTNIYLIVDIFSSLCFYTHYLFIYVFLLVLHVYSPKIPFFHQIYILLNHIVNKTSTVFLLVVKMLCTLVWNKCLDTFFFCCCQFIKLLCL